jgi:hypothetical protein
LLPRVSGGGGVVVELEDVSSEGGIIRYVGGSVGQKEYSFGGGVPGPSFRESACGFFYVQELLHIRVGRVCLNYLGAEVRVVDAALGIEFEGGDESFFWEKGSFSGFVVVGWKEVGAAGEGIRLDHLSTGEMD